MKNDAVLIMFEAILEHEAKGQTLPFNGLQTSDLPQPVEPASAVFKVKSDRLRPISKSAQDSLSKIDAPVSEFESNSLLIQISHRFKMTEVKDHELFCCQTTVKQV